MTRIAVCVLLVVASLMVLPAAAAVSPDDAASEAYTRARYELYRAIDRNLPASSRAVKGFVRQVVSECRGVLFGAPDGAQRFELGLEEALLLGRVFFHPDNQAGLAFDNAVKRLRWTSSRITRLARAGGRPTPNADIRSRDLCADFQVWAASGYHSLSNNTARLLAKGKARSAESSEEVLWRLLSRYKSSGSEAKIRQVKLLETHVRDASEGMIWRASRELSKQL